LAISLGSLLVGFNVAGATHYIAYIFYFLGEYTFGLLFIAGCRNHASSRRIERKHVWMFVLAVLVAIALPALSEDFNNLFIVQASIMAGMFAVAYLELRPAYRLNAGPGVSVTSAALFLLSLDFLQYVPIFGSHQAAWGLPIPDVYFQYTSILDLI